MGNLYERDLYTQDNKQLIIGTDIYEYDIHHAGISISREYNLLPSDSLDDVEKSAKDKKDISIILGKIQRKDPKYKKDLADGFVRARKNFFEANDIVDEQVISIKKDAIFTTKKCDVTEFGHIIFANKHTYSSFLKMKNLEFYYNSGDNSLDIKGIDDNDLKFHEDYMMNFIKKFFYKLEFESAEVAKQYVCAFADSYKQLELDPEYYRTFDKFHNYVSLDNDIEYQDIGPDILPSIDISYNYLNIITPLLVSIL